MLAGDHIDQATKQNKLRPVRCSSYSFLVLPLIVHYCDITWQFPWSSFSPSNICLKEQFDRFGKFTYCHKLHSPISRYKSLSLSAPVCVWSTCIKSKTTFFGKPPGGVTQWHLRWCRSYKLGFDSNNIQQTYCFSNRNSNSNHANECSKHSNRLENSCQNAVLFFHYVVNVEVTTCPESDFGIVGFCIEGLCLPSCHMRCQVYLLYIFPPGVISHSKQLIQEIQLIQESL